MEYKHWDKGFELHIIIELMSRMARTTSYFSVIIIMGFIDCLHITQPYLAAILYVD